MNIYDQLRRPFPAHKIHWRVGSMTKARDKGMALAYIDARDVMNRLDKVVGCENWQCRYPLSDNGLLICEVGIRASVFGLDRGDWIWKSNGSGETDIEAKKGACSKSFVRAGVVWGIGQYLYALPTQWHPLDEYKRFTKASIAIMGESLPTWAKPEGFDKLMGRKKVSEFMAKKLMAKKGVSK